jgi:enoyl-[acyl-carrier protein] reductase I
MLLEGKKGVVLSVTNDKSIGWAIADHANRNGAQVMVGGQNERLLERVDKLIEGREGMSSVAADFQIESDLVSLAKRVEKDFGKIDFFVHSAAYANRDDLQGRFIETSKDGFSLALEISAYSLVSVCRTLEPLFNEDASVIALSYLGSTRAVGNYNVMGVAKAALEACVRYLAVDLGPKGIRVNTLSPGPVNTVAARGVKGFLEMISYVEDRAPLKRSYGQDEVAGSAMYLLSDLSKGVSGQLIFIDSGYNIVGL